MGRMKISSTMNRFSLKSFGDSIKEEYQAYIWGAQTNHDGQKLATVPRTEDSVFAGHEDAEFAFQLVVYRL